MDESPVLGSEATGHYQPNARCLEEILNRKKEKKRERRPEGREKFGLEQKSGLPWPARLIMRWYPLVILNLLEGYAWL